MSRTRQRVCVSLLLKYPEPRGDQRIWYKATQVQFQLLRGLEARCGVFAGNQHEAIPISGLRAMGVGMVVFSQSLILL